MIEQDCNLKSSTTLPTSTHPLMDFKSLYILRRKVLDSVFIAPSPGDDSKEENLFDHPIQVVVLGIDGDDVKLGIYAHPKLAFTQGLPTIAEWCQHWQSEWDHPSRDTANSDEPSRPWEDWEPQMPTEENMAFIGSTAEEELERLEEAHYLLYQMMEALFDSEETRLSTNWRLAKAGFTQWKDWLLMREARVKRLADEACA